MRKWCGALLALVLLAGPAFAEPTRGKTLLDTWDAAYLQGAKTGYVRTTVVEIERDGRKLLRGTMELSLTLKRFQDAINLRMETGTEETPEGKVTGVFMRQYLGRQQQLVVTGVVRGREVHLRASGKSNMTWKAPWNDKVLGLYRQQRLFQDRKVKPGDEFDVQTFEPTINLVVTVHVKVKGYEEVAVPGTRARKRLLRAEMKPEKVENTQLPTLIVWLDRDREPARSQTEMPGLGDLVLVRTERGHALKKGSAAKAVDLGISQLVPLKRRIPHAHDSRAAVYRITLRGDDDAASAFVQDGRQVVKNARGDTFELHVRASRGPDPEGADKEAGEEFLQSSYFINCDDARVKALTRQAVGAEKDPWKKALRIERWVHNHMTFRNDEELATADHVARTLAGDCTEHAMLAAAMCRAAGVPSRTAMGLIYADTRKGPVMGFHMWTEVWVRGQWVPLDATLGQGYVGASHLKITDHSWHETRDLKPLLPFLRVVGKVKIEVVSVR